MPNILIKDSYKLFLEKMSGDDVKSVILALINQDDTGLDGNAAVAYGVIMSDKIENDKRKAQKRGSYGSYHTHRGTGSYWTRNEYTPHREDDTVEKIVLTEAHMDDLIRMMPEHADEVVWIIDAAMQLQKDPDADILEICRHYDLDVVASWMVLDIVQYNDQHPIRENTLACGYQSEAPEWY